MTRASRLLTLVVICAFLLSSPLTALGQGKILADTGFRPKPHGFSFPNYGNENKPVNLTPDKVRELLGDKACKTIKDGACVLTASAENWMKTQNQEMDGGHCEGMAALSTLVYAGKVKLSDLDPNAKSVNDLKPDNPKVQAEIAKWFTTQMTDPTASSAIKKSPNDIVDTLIQKMQPGAAPFTMGIYQPDGSGGHAITPYAVVDMGNGKVRIMVYDNNYPNAERWIDVDRAKNTWQYTGSTNPAEQETGYQGDANSGLELTPLEARAQLPQKCEECLSGNANAEPTTPTNPTQPGSTDNGGQAQQPQATTNAPANTPAGSGCSDTAITVDGDTDTVVTSDGGEVVSVKKGKITAKASGVRVIRLRNGVKNKTNGVLILVPKKAAPKGKFALAVKGNTKQDGNKVAVATCGKYWSASGLSQADGKADTMSFDPDLENFTSDVDPGEHVSFAGGSDNPNGKDYSFEVNDVKSNAKDSNVINLSEDADTGKLLIDSEEPTTYDLKADALSPDGTETSASYDDVSEDAGKGSSINLDKTGQDKDAFVDDTPSDKAAFDEYDDDQQQAEQDFGAVESNDDEKSQPDSGNSGTGGNDADQPDSDNGGQDQDAASSDNGDADSVQSDPSGANQDHDEPAGNDGGQSSSDSGGQSDAGADGD